MDHRPSAAKTSKAKITAILYSVQFSRHEHTLAVYVVVCTVHSLTTSANRAVGITCRPSDNYSTAANINRRFDSRPLATVSSARAAVARPTRADSRGHPTASRETPSQHHALDQSPSKTCGDETTTPLTNPIMGKGKGKRSRRNGKHGGKTKKIDTGGTIPPSDYQSSSSGSDSDSYDSSMDLETTPTPTQTILNSPIPNNNQDNEKNLVNSAPSTKTPKIPPIILASADWRKIAPTILHAINAPINDLTAKIATDGSVRIQTSSITSFRYVQKTLTENSVNFHSFSLPEDRVLKVVIRGVPTDISENEIKSELEILGFDVKLIKRFGANSKPIPICLVFITKNHTAAEIYNLNNLFYMTVRVETFRKSGPAQCYQCQRFGHGSSNCNHSPRCVKCAGDHNAKDCPKTLEQAPTCVNCGGNHTANYRGCEWYKHVLATNSTTTKPNKETLAKYPTVLPTDHTQQNSQQSRKASYAYITSKLSTPQEKPPQNHIAINTVLTLLTELLLALQNSENPKDATVKVINAFISLLKPQNQNQNE